MKLANPSDLLLVRLFDRLVVVVSQGTQRTKGMKPKRKTSLLIPRLIRSPRWSPQRSPIKRRLPKMIFQKKKFLPLLVHGRHRLKLPVPFVIARQILPFAPYNPFARLLTLSTLPSVTPDAMRPKSLRPGVHMTRETVYRLCINPPSLSHKSVTKLRKDKDGIKSRKKTYRAKMRVRQTSPTWMQELLILKISAEVQLLLRVPFEVFLQVLLLLLLQHPPHPNLTSVSLLSRLPPLLLNDPRPTTLYYTTILLAMPQVLPNHAFLYQGSCRPKR